ncbi:MAG: T9SS type A sorting domain-containing protein [Bacteroidales bacterium]
MRRHLLTAIFCVFIYALSYAQIRKDGIPQIILKKKIINRSNLYQTADIPSQFKNFRISDKHLKRRKSLQFAYPFYANLTPNNSGRWQQGSGTTEIWTLEIKSADAKSINLIIDSFHMPPSAKLYVWGNEEDLPNGYIGAHNNNGSKTLAVLPTKGDIINIQLEVEYKEKDRCSLHISQISHDYYGVFNILKRLSGSCEINSNCNTEEQWVKSKKAICQMIIEGISLCTGTVMNNTNNDFTPYVLTANHCYEGENIAQRTLYIFMKESPNCVELSANRMNSISGGIYKANSVKQDYYLTEINKKIPIHFQTYYSGWTREKSISNNNACIHHPQGDKKKISISLQAPTIEAYTDSELTVNHAWQIKQWNSGTTEGGSSGAGLFDNLGYYRGSLIGGDASCSNPVFDFFSAFYKNWDFETVSSMQLKYWLDPLGIDPTTLDGKFYDDNTCNTETNSSPSDTICNSPLGTSSHIAGTNNMNVTEIVEKFQVNTKTPIYQVLIGTKNADAVYSNNVTLNIYDEKDGLPGNLLYSQVFSIANLERNSWHSFSLSKKIEVSETFFVGFDITQLNYARAELSVLTTSLPKNRSSTFYYKRLNKWNTYYSSDGKPRSLLIGINQCSNILNDIDSTNTNKKTNIDIYPNPISNVMYIKSDKEVTQIEVIDLSGRIIETSTSIGYLNDDLSIFDMSSIPNGLYILAVSNKKARRYFKIIVNHR